jgi:hypothetical protein
MKKRKLKKRMAPTAYEKMHETTMFNETVDIDIDPNATSKYEEELVKHGGNS